MTSPRAEAEANQLAASDPRVSAFVAASAGSGKTRLLTDRLLRLMVEGAKPERILCLTFTKAAAAEMSVRLQRRLGGWVTLDQDALARELRGLAVDPTAGKMDRARSLFATVLDLPGGVRISTIHAFCQSLLRRFPLEAEISPHFQLADDRDAAEAMTEAREVLLASVRPRGESNALSPRETALRALAGVATLSQFTSLVTTLKTKHRALAHREDEIAAARRRLLGVTAPDSTASIAEAVAWPGEAEVAKAARAAVQSDKTSARPLERAKSILSWLGQPRPARRDSWNIWRKLFVKEDGEPYAASSFANPVLDRTNPSIVAALLAEAHRVLAIDDLIRAADTASVSEALCDLAWPLLEQYAARKSASGLLEFDDLIGRSTALLIDPGAQWVLYKLDGGLDHLLLDEVQDTSPEQWAIAHRLTQEFFAGEGAREEARTVFAVGDRKQSIFSFQGADVAGFERARALLGQRVTEAGLAWVEKPLNVSFRSTAPVLALTDAVFADPAAAAGVLLPGEILQHRADRFGHAGRVEIWPLVEAPPPEPPAPWSAPKEYRRAASALEILADNLAGWIADQTNGEVLLESKGRKLRPGDIMILVRHRDALPAALVRALKSRGIPVSGLDRMLLTGQPAVQDLLALADALLLPQDDLTFGCLLTSPLGGLDDTDLMALAIGRERRPLWAVLRDRHREKAAWSDAWLFFSALLARVDFVSPHALFAEALGSLGGRAKLMARLGAEAAEPIDELLNAALNYTRVHPPSLQGFLQWLRRSGAEITRQPEAAGDQVRILTVHGAKGLQAPVVILPDTTSLPREDDGLLWDIDPASGLDIPIWVPNRAFHSFATMRIRDAARRRRRDEYNRLLYVALTRAEDRLVVCGAMPKRGVPPDDCWYSAIARGFATLGHVPEDGFARIDSPQTVGPDIEKVAAADEVSRPPPPFLDTPPPPEPPRPTPLAPSRPEGVELGRLPASASPLTRAAAGPDRFRRGKLVHALLQHLPAIPDAARLESALRFLRAPGHGLPAGAAEEIAAETLAILRDPALSQLFGPGSKAEVPLTGVVGDAVVGGLVDRIAVLPERTILADFKTNRQPPATVEATPVAYLRQMASYRAVLKIVFPGRPVDCALIWTREPRVSWLPEALLDRYSPEVPTG